MEKNYELEYDLKELTEEQKEELLKMNESFLGQMLQKKKRSIGNFFFNFVGTVAVGLLPQVWPLFIVPGIFGLLESFRIGRIEEFIKFLEFEKQKLEESIS